MNRNRVVLLFGVAWLAAGLLSWMIYRRATAPSSRDTVQVVAAARELPAGRRLAAADLKMAEVARKDLPAGYQARIPDVLERAVLLPLSANELVLESKLAPKQGGEGLTAIIEPGKRAVTVQVNETIGVAGFVQPGSKVDVVFTRSLPNGDSAATTILQNVTVLAFGRNLQRPSQKPGEAPPAPVSGPQATVTLLVTPEEAARLALATQRGKIQLALRNPLDTETPEAEPVYAEDLGIAEPERGPRGPALAPQPAAPLPPPKPKDPKEGKVVVKVFRGTKVSEDIF
jgi:pilus assembly protein CpaB